jgi:hypothetical protein
MEYPHLGRTGLTVSRIALGALRAAAPENRPGAHGLMDRALEHGINCLDTSNIYGLQDGDDWSENVIAGGSPRAAAGASAPCWPRSSTSRRMTGPTTAGCRPCTSAGPATTPCDGPGPSGAGRHASCPRHGLRHRTRRPVVPRNPRRAAQRIGLRPCLARRLVTVAERRRRPRPVRRPGREQRRGPAHRLQALHPRPRRPPQPADRPRPRTVLEVWSVPVRGKASGCTNRATP